MFRSTKPFRTSDEIVRPAIMAFCSFVLILTAQHLGHQLAGAAQAAPEPHSLALASK
ncbi:hypothetical protein [Aureimonas sp. AU40]|uniref:hypothetical protein n=1 Tax=Aureimonas sp. AU40 TaxID=1637747 RepID=UPI000A9F40B9|nr:hypothetical protein [Aureimonas sp. AU40]